MGYAVENMLVACIMLSVVIYCSTTDLRKVRSDGWVLYYTKTCGHCIDQIDGLGWGGLWFLNSTDCTSAGAVRPPDITAFPSWKNMVTGKVYMGVIDRKDLLSVLAV